MTRIVVDPEHLQALAALLQRHSADLKATADQLNGIMNTLNPQEAKQLNITGEWEQARSLAHSLSDQAGGEASKLGLKARNLQEADRDSAAQMARMFADFQVVLHSAPAGWQPGAYTPPVPQDLIGRVSALGGAEDAVVPAASVAGLAAMVGISGVTTRRLGESRAADKHTTTNVEIATGPIEHRPLAAKGADGAR